jgi:hypothetical protein
MKELKYSYGSLQKFCSENGIELCKDYSSKKINRVTTIEGKCKTDGCEQLFNKVFRELKQNMTPYCVKCVYELAVKKRKITFLKTYGVEHLSQHENIKQKKIETALKHYGVENISQSQEIKNKKKETCLKNWGVEHQSKSEIIKNKKIETCFKNSGYNYPMQNQETKEKSKQTSLNNFGVEHPSQSLEIKDKIKKNNLKKWGVEYTLQNEQIRQKGVDTCMRKYGVKNPIQNPEIAEKALSGYKTKYYVFPSGKTVKYQGYENLALNELIQTISENDILNSRTDVPSIWYTTDNGVKHRHYVDIFIPTKNLCIEVKSVWTITFASSNIYLKQQAAKDLGYKYEIWVYNKKEEKIICYE